MTTELVCAPAAANRGEIGGLARGELYLAFLLGTETFAIEIDRIREIVEYSQPTEVPMMPPSVRGVVNLRGGVVPIIDLAVRFGSEPATVGMRTCFVIVEVDAADSMQVMGLVVDRVKAVTEIRAVDIEPPPAFGARIDTEFILGMARSENRFTIILNVARALSIEEMAASGRAAASGGESEHERPTRV